MCAEGSIASTSGVVIVTKDGIEELNKIPTQMWII